MVSAGVPAMFAAAAVCSLVAGVETQANALRRSLKANLGSQGRRVGLHPPILRHLARDIVLPHLPAAWVTAERERLGRAGLDAQPEVGLTIRFFAVTASGVGGALLAAKVRALRPGHLTAVSAVCAMFGLLIAEWWLVSRARSRKRLFRRDWPDLLLQVRLCLLAGMTLEQALGTLANYPAPGRSQVLRSQVADLTARVRAGTPPEAAIAAWARSLGVDEISVFAASVERSRTLGVPLAEALDRQAELARARLRHDYLAWLNNLPSRLSLCAMVFFFPAVLIVVLLPNVLSFLRSGW